MLEVVGEVRLSLQTVVNRELSGIGNRALFDQTISLAKRTVDNLVEVNTTANCRESHASWQGGIHQLEGSGEHRNFYTACRWGDPVNGIGGYNCGHRFRIYRPADGRRFEDPLGGTGYTIEDARRLKGSQRRYERIIRNAKLEIEAIDRSGIDNATKAELKRAARARMADARTRMNMLIAEHPKLLKREQWRERTYTQRFENERTGRKESPDRQGPENTENSARLANQKNMGRYSFQPGPFAKSQLSLEEYKELRAYADERGISLSCIKDTYADPVVVRALVDAAHNVITTEGFEFLGNHGKNRLTIEQWASKNDFGMTKGNVPHIIYVIKNLMENAEEFAKAYAKEVEDGWLVAGTTYEAVIYHEIGHIYQTRKGFSPIRIARKMFGTKSWDIIREN